MCALPRFLLEYFSRKCRIAPLKSGLGDEFKTYFRVVEQQSDLTPSNLCSHGELAIYTVLINNPTMGDKMWLFFTPPVQKGFCRGYFYPLVSDFALNSAGEFSLYVDVDIDVSAFC